jgi:integrase
MRSHLKRLNSVLGDQPLRMKYPVVQGFFTDQAINNAPKTVRNLYSTYHNVMASALREGLIEKIHTVALPKSTRKEQEWLSVKAMTQVIAASQPTLKPLYATLAETGLRIGEALGLKGEDLDEINRTLEIRRSVYGGKVQAPKTAASYRTITLSPYLVDLLKSVATGTPEDFLFRSSSGAPLLPEKVLINSLHPLLADLKLKPAGFHAFRRGNATLMCSVLGVPEKVAAYRLGHKAPGLTLGLYAQSFTGIDKEWTPKIGEALFK